MLPVVICAVTKLYKQARVLVGRRRSSHFVPNQRHFEFITNYDIMRACPALSLSCLGSFGFVRAGSFRVFTVLNTMKFLKFLEPIYQSLSKSVSQLEHIQSQFFKLRRTQRYLRRSAVLHQRRTFISVKLLDTF